jgi:hypothetical protein
VNHQLPNPLHKPVLDECVFHQLLSAAYTLQQQNGTKKDKLDIPKTLVDEIIADLGDTPSQAASFKPLPSETPQLALPRQTPVLRATHTTIVRSRITKNNEFFWGIATAVAVASVSVLLLGASINRFSPLPAALARPSEGLQHQSSLQKARAITTILDESSGVNNETIATEPDAATQDAPAQRLAVDQPPRSKPASVRKKTLNRKHHSARARQSDIVAPNTVIRYGPHSTAPLDQAHKYP